MDYAVIDLGSNSIRLAIYEYENDQVQKIFDEKDVAGLAGYVSDGVLQTAGIQKACEVLNHFKRTASKFVAPQDIHLFATASLRNVRNRDEAVHTIARETSLVPDVLEGSEEAALGFVGVSKFANCDNGVMIDIGGASTELVLFNDHKAVNLVSLPIGSLNLSVKYVKGIIPTKHERKRIKSKIRDQLSAVYWGGEGQYPLLVGTGGTLRAVRKLSSALFDLPADGRDISASYVKEIIKLLKKNENHIYQVVYKTIPERLLTISTGLYILQQVIKKFGCETILVSNFGVREGYLVDRVLKTNDRYVIDRGTEES